MNSMVDVALGMMIVTVMLIGSGILSMLIGLWVSNWKRPGREVGLRAAERKKMDTGSHGEDTGAHGRR